MWLGPRARRDASRASATRGASRATRAGRPGRQRCRLADQARARDRPPRHRSPDEPRDRRRAVPQRQDGRVAPAQHLPQARRDVAGRGRASGRTGAQPGPQARRRDLARAARGSRRRAPGGARVPTGAGAWAAPLRQRRDRIRRHLARRRPVRGGARRPGRGRSGVGVGPARRAGGPVPVAGRVRGAGVGVSDRGGRVPVEPSADGRHVRLAQRLGGDLRLLRGEHDDRLPRRAVGPHARRHRAHAQRDRRHRHGPRRRLRGRRRARASTSSGA